MNEEMGDVDENEQGEIFDEKKWGNEEKEEEESVRTFF